LHLNQLLVSCELEPCSSSCVNRDYVGLYIAQCGIFQTQRHPASGNVEALGIRTVLYFNDDYFVMCI